MKKRIVVAGRVQGVGFRAYTQYQAVKLGVTGWVRNLGYEYVEIEAIASPEVLDAFVELVRQGPRASRVEHIEIEDLPEGNTATGFEIRASR